MKGLRVAGKLFLGIVILGFILRQADLGQMSLVWNSRSVLGVTATVFLLITAVFLSAVRWRLVLGDQAPPLRFLWRVYLIGWCFGLFLPTSVGGDAVRAVAITRGRTSVGEAVTSIAMERLLGVGALGVYLLIGCLSAPAVIEAAVGITTWTITWWHLAAAAALAILGLVAVVRIGRRIPRIRAILTDAAATWRHLKASPNRLVRAIAASLLVQGCYVLAWYSLALGVRLEVSFLALLVFVPFVSLAAMVPVTLSGLGVREGVWSLLLAPMGVAVADAVGFSLLYYASTLIVGLVGGVLFLTSGTDLKRANNVDGRRIPASVAQVS